MRIEDQQAQLNRNIPEVDAGLKEEIMATMMAEGGMVDDDNNPLSRKSKLKREKQVEKNKELANDSKKMLKDHSKRIADKLVATDKLQMQESVNDAIKQEVGELFSKKGLQTSKDQVVISQGMLQHQNKQLKKLNQKKKAQSAAQAQQSDKKQMVAPPIATPLKKVTETISKTTIERTQKMNPTSQAPQQNMDILAKDYLTLIASNYMGHQKIKKEKIDSKRKELIKQGIDTQQLSLMEKIREVLFIPISEKKSKKAL